MNEFAVLSRAAERARKKPEFISYILGEYGRIENISRSELLKLLNISEVEFVRLQLCLRPRQEHFESDVTKIAVLFRIDRFVLAKIIRLVDSLHTMSEVENCRTASDRGSLLAARSRAKKKKKQK